MNRSCPDHVPPSLKPGDKVAILSPASKIDPELIDAAAERLRAEGLAPVVMPHAKGVCGSFSGTVEERLSDLTDALGDDRVRAIVCSRGGYGAVHLLPPLDALPPRLFDKWLVGFSDITALHCLWHRKGVVSLHAAMAKHLGRGPEGFSCYGDEMAMLRGDFAEQEFPPHIHNVPGTATGPVVGGNLAVLGGLVGTPYDPISEGSILFVEDIAEPIYKVERILWQLKLRGVFNRIAGFMAGRFTDYKPSADHDSMEDMMERFFRPYQFPRAYGLPIGHIEDNHPILLGHFATLSVAPGSVRVSPLPPR